MESSALRFERGVPRTTPSHHPQLALGEYLPGHVSGPCPARSAASPTSCDSDRGVGGTWKVGQSPARDRV